jgi:hypothetical protein
MKEKEKKGCSQCKQNLSTIQTGMLVLSVYIFITAIYGNIKLFKYITSLF